MNKLHDYLTKNKGSRKKLAQLLGGISRQNMQQLISGSYKISPARCVIIEEWSEGEVTRQDLRLHDYEEIWPELKD